MASGQITTGSWRAELETPGGPLPFHFELTPDSGGYVFTLLNGDERLATTEVRIEGDDFGVKLPVFHSAIQATISPDAQCLSGQYRDYSRGENYALPFSARAGVQYRFLKHPDTPQFNISGKWATQFVTKSEAYEAIGVFSQNGSRLQGTFLTATGDYRFLEGDVSGNQFFLSTFDGTHAYLFKGVIESDSSLSGTLFSGNHWQETFTAVRNDSARLPDAEKLTYLKPGYDSVYFCFPDAAGDTICSSDSRFNNKITIVQIMGTWCPNCMDESAFLAELYAQYHPLGLEIIALAFERETSPQSAAKNFEKLKNHFGIHYPILLAGSSNKTEASNALPMLNAVIAFPTLILLDRNKQVIAIHTGFNGPATGQLFVDFTGDFRQKIEQLLK